jgi:hypothetical protein
MDGRASEPLLRYRERAVHGAAQPVVRRAGTAHVRCGSGDQSIYDDDARQRGLHMQVAGDPAASRARLSRSAPPSRHTASEPSPLAYSSGHPHGRSPEPPSLPRSCAAESAERVYEVTDPANRRTATVKPAGLVAERVLRRTSGGRTD